jgi:FkbM family methyltransferase
MGLGLFTLCDAFPKTKAPLQRLGLRTSKEWIGDRVVTAQMPDGRGLKLASAGTNYLSFELFWRGTGYYEPITTMVLEQLLQPNDTFYDVGANVGFYSLVLSVMHSGLRVIAFEPNPKTFKLLDRNVRANRLREITCVPVAVSDSNDGAVLHLSQSDMSASLDRHFDSRVTASFDVPTTTLDSYVTITPPRGRVVIKVDVEGHEVAFFAGARETITRLVPDIVTEVVVNCAHIPYAWLRECGYRFYSITNRGLVESELLTPVVYGPYAFYNYLLSSRNPVEIKQLFEQIRPRVESLPLAQTSKNVGPEMIKTLRTRGSRSSAPVDVQR